MRESEGEGEGEREREPRFDRFGDWILVAVVVVRFTLGGHSFSQNDGRACGDDDASCADGVWERLRED